MIMTVMHPRGSDFIKPLGSSLDHSAQLTENEDFERRNVWEGEQCVQLFFFFNRFI